MRAYYIYRHFGVNGLLQYIGFTQNPRVRAYRKTSWDVARVELTYVGNDFQEALNMEQEAIMTEKPKYNVQRSIPKKLRVKVLMKPMQFLGNLPAITLDTVYANKKKPR